MKNILGLIIVFFIGICCVFSQENEEMLNALNQQISDDPENAYFYKARGDIKVLLGDINESINDYNKSIELYPTYFEAYISRGMANYKSQNYEDALKDFNFCIENSDKVNEEMFFNRALVFHDLKSYPEAIADYNKTIELNNKYEDAYYNKALVYLEQEMYKESKEMLNKAIELNSNESYFLVNRGYVNYELSEYNMAIIDLKKSVEINPTFYIAFKWIGLSYMKLNDKEAACIYLSKAKENGIEDLDDYLIDCI